MSLPGGPYELSFEPIRFRGRNDGAEVTTAEADVGEVSVQNYSAEGCKSHGCPLGRHRSGRYDSRLACQVRIGFFAAPASSQRFTGMS